MKITKAGAVMLFVGGFAAGCAYGPGSAVISHQFGIAPAAAQAADAQSDDRLLTLFASVFDRVRADYVEPVSGRSLINNALNGMLTGLDPHSSYLTEQQWHDMQTETDGRFGGVGLEVTDNGGLLEVVSPIDGTPAALAGLKPGDIITAVNDKTVEGMSLSNAVAAMRGLPDTALRLTIRRKGATQPIELTLIRKIIEVHAVKSRLLGDIGLIRISEFTKQTDPGVRAAIEAFRAQAGSRLRGVILDLRNDPGGLLEQAVAVSDDFLSHGAVVSTRGRHTQDDQSWSAETGGDLIKGLPIVVLTNNGTASAAEIVAGALQDNRRALVLGTQSFGKGSVQTLMPLPGNGAIRLTTARYYTPSGRSIQGLGITPDVTVEETHTPQPHFGPQREADLLHILTNPGGGTVAEPPPPVDMPPIAQDIPKLPPADWPTLDPARPSTDFQLQQALVLIHGMSAQGQASAR